MNHCIYETKADSQTYRTDLWLPRVWLGGEGRIGNLDQEIQTSIYGWINNKVLLYIMGNYIQHPVINHNGKEYEKACVCVCV